MNKHLKNYRTESFNGSKPLGIRALANESGAVLVVALLFIAVLITLAPVAMQMTSGEMDRSGSFTDDREVFYLAEAGLEHGKSVIINSTDLDDILTGPDGDPATADDNGTVNGIGDTADATPFLWNGIAYDDVAFGTQGGIYYFRVYDNDDGDGDLNADTDDLAYVEGVGINAAGDVKTVRALNRKLPLIPVTMPAAVTMTGPVSRGTSQGSQFKIYGAEDPNYLYGADINGNEDPTCPGVSAVSTESTGPIETQSNINDCVTDTCLQFGGSQWNKWYGTGGPTGDDYQTDQTDFTGSDAEALWAQFTASGVPTNVYSSSQIYTGNVTFGSAISPQIEYYQADMTIDAGIFTGYGVLIVDGTLHVERNQTLNWNGIIIVGGCPSCTGDLTGTGHSDIYGAVVVGNSTSSQMHLNGNTNIHYSCQGIAIASLVDPNAGKPAVVLSWNEVD